MRPILWQIRENWIVLVRRINTRNASRFHLISKIERRNQQLMTVNRLISCAISRSAFRTFFMIRL